MKVPKNISLVTLDTTNCMSGNKDLQGFEEHTCSGDFLKQIISNPRTKCVYCPIAELCGWKKSFLLYFHDMSDVWMERLSVGQNNEAATLLMLDPATGYPKHVVQGIAYVMYDNGRYQLSKEEVNSLCQAAKSAIDAFSTGELRGNDSNLDRWCDQYKKEERSGFIPSFFDVGATKKGAKKCHRRKRSQGERILSESSLL